MSKLNTLVFLLVLAAGLCGCFLDSLYTEHEKKADEIAPVEPQRWSDWKVRDVGVYGGAWCYQKKEGEHILEVHTCSGDFDGQWYYDIVPFDTTKEVITSTPTVFSSREHAIQSCEARYQQLIEGDK